MQQHPRGVCYGSMVAGRPTAVRHSAVTVDQLAVGVAAAGSSRVACGGIRTRSAAGRIRKPDRRVQQHRFPVDADPDGMVRSHLESGAGPLRPAGWPPGPPARLPSRKPGDLDPARPVALGALVDSAMRRMLRGCGLSSGAGEIGRTVGRHTWIRTLGDEGWGSPRSRPFWVLPGRPPGRDHMRGLQERCGWTARKR